MIKTELQTIEAEQQTIGAELQMIEAELQTIDEPTVGRQTCRVGKYEQET
jgi:prefoldin subunit 5